jgi:hypothetical protein
MALNPDDLLIFKVREGDKPQVSKEKKKPVVFQPAPAPQPIPQPQPIQQPQRVEQKAVPVQKPQSEPRKPFFQRSEPKPKPQPPPEPVQEYTQDEEADYYIAPPEYTASSADVVGSALEVAGVQKPKSNERLKKERDPKKIAQHMSCELHPWRRAYAICNYCKRAFCYEDIVESGGKYYCLDDIENVPEAQRRSQMVRYNNLALLSSVLFMLIFLVFFYYSYQQMITVFGTLGKLGVNIFIKDITNTELFLIAEVALAIGSFITAMMILVSHPKSFRVSSLVGVATVGLFLYRYIYINKIYFVAIATMSFIALITLAYSRVSYESLADTGDMPSIDVAKSSSF